MPQLEVLGPAHAEAVLAFERANREYFAASITDRGEEYFDQFAERHDELLARQVAGLGAYYVLVDDGGSVIGRFNLTFAGERSAELGYRVAAAVAGQGVATAAVHRLCDLARSRHDLSSLRAATSLGNLASQRVLAKLGFVAVGPADPVELGGKPGTWYELSL